MTARIPKQLGCEATISPIHRPHQSRTLLPSADINDPGHSPFTAVTRQQIGANWKDNAEAGDNTFYCTLVHGPQTLLT
jgi:hypothetical protein